MGIDVERLRADTPGLAHVTHLQAAGAGLMPRPVIDAITSHIELEGRIGGYEAAAAQAEQLDGVYNSVADLIGAGPREIALTENATAAWCQAFYALALRAGDRVITSAAEYAANYVAFLHRVRRDGIVIDVAPSDASGAVDPDAVEALITSRTALISLTWVPTNGGLVNPAAAIGQIARKHGIAYLLDACQAVGQMPVDVQALGCDFLSATGRKFLRGPRGTGFLYVAATRIAALEPAMIDHFAAPWVAADRYQLRDDARRFENWENAYALRAGLGAAVDYALDIGLEAIERRVRQLADELRRRLLELKGAQIRDAGTQRCAIVSFTIDGLAPEMTVQALRARKICIGASTAASTRLDAEARRLPPLMRAAPHYYNSSADLDVLIKALHELM